MKNVIEELKKMLGTKGITKTNDFVGCSESEINKLEKHFNLRLPLVYKEFLREMGHKAENYQVGTNMFYDDLFKLREQFEGILDDNGNPFLLKDSIFVFSGHQGVIFHFFDTEENSVDPPVYGYCDGDENMRLIYDKYSVYLFDI